MLDVSKKIQFFTDLVAWQKGHIVVLEVYKLTSEFPANENYGLSSQMKRCAVSITSNIAEGFSRNSNKEKDQFFSIASGSCSELKNQLLITKDVGFISETEFNKVTEKLNSTHKVLNGLRRANRLKRNGANVKRQPSNV